MEKEFAWIPIAFFFVQLLGLSLQETGIPDVRANYQEMRNQERRSRRAQGQGDNLGVEYRKIGRWRLDLRCGSRFSVNGEPGECNPNGKYPCCSPRGWCGITKQHCNCYRCIDFSNQGQGKRYRGADGPLRLG